MAITAKTTLNSAAVWPIICSNTPAKPLIEAQIGGFFYACSFREVSQV